MRHASVFSCWHDAAEPRRESGDCSPSELLRFRAAPLSSSMRHGESPSVCLQARTVDLRRALPPLPEACAPVLARLCQLPEVATEVRTTCAGAPGRAGAMEKGREPAHFSRPLPLLGPRMTGILLSCMRGVLLSSECHAAPAGLRRRRAFTEPDTGCSSAIRFELIPTGCLERRPSGSGT